MTAATLATERQVSKRSFTPWTNRYVEWGAIGAWFWTTANRFDHDTEVLYLLCGYFLVGAYVHRRQMVALCARGWPLLTLLPWALLSVAWSAAPVETVKYALEEVLTVLICFYIVARMSPQALITALFIALSYFEIVSLRSLGGGADNFQGVFADKNTLAYRMSVLAFAGLALMLDRRQHRYLRYAAAPIVLVALYMIYKAHSATSTIAGAIGVALMLGCAWVWAPARGYRALIIALGVAAIAAIGLLLVQQPNFDLRQSVLEAFGKDTTLTGRKELWDYAGELIKQKPLLGLGPGGFWLPGRLDAQELLETHYKTRGISWEFHNSYVEITVYLGFIGLGLGLIGWIWSFSTNIYNMLTRASVATAFFAAIAVVMLSRSYVESDLWKQFEFGQMIIWAGALYMWRRPAAGLVPQR